MLKICDKNRKYATASDRAARRYNAPLYYIIPFQHVPTIEKLYFLHLAKILALDFLVANIIVLYSGLLLHVVLHAFTQQLLQYAN